MTSENWRTAWALYKSARELPSAERAVFLTSIDTDPEVLKEVTSLLDEPDEPSQEAEQNQAGTLASFGMGRYTVLDYLGKGGMSEVYSARDRQLGRIVALKLLRPGIIGVRSAERVMREAKTLSGLNHPNIVTVYEVINSAAGLAIVMELVEGVSLRSLCATSLPEDRVLGLGQQIAQALATAHAHGIVHRDIKPENILVRSDGYVKVVDFGLARQVAADDCISAYGLIAGTLRYMSPEQVRGEPLSAATDVFSLGLILYELTLGERPFGGSSLETAYFITTKPIAPLSRAARPISSRLEQLIITMLAKNPAERPPATRVAKELGELSTISAIPGVAVSSSPYRKNGFWLATLLACAIAVAAIAWLAYEKRDTPGFADLKIQPLTAQPGWEDAPALSPDGQSIAFTWADKLNGVRNIYVKRLSEQNPVKLTSNSEGSIGNPAWSPDGKRIAFKRSGKVYEIARGGLYSVPAGGGREEKLLDLVNPDLSSSIDWSPDGTELAFSDVMPGKQRLALYLFNMQTGETRRLTSPPESAWGDWSPKFSPDGVTLAFKRVTSFWVDDLYLVPERGGALQQVTDAKRGIWGHAWMPDGKSLLVSCQRTGSIFGIWRFPLKSNVQPERVSLAGVDAITPTTSRKTNQIAWVDQLWDLNIYRIATTGVGAPVKLIASTLRDQGATYSPDGRIAFVSDRSGIREIWLARADGSGQVRVTNLQGPPIDYLVWSPDGHQLAFESPLAGYPGVFTLDCHPAAMSCSQPRRLSSQNTSESTPAWSRDGKFLYFASLRTGRWEVWKRPSDGGAPIQITHDGGYTSCESWDGKWLYFSKQDTGAIFRMPLPASTPQSASSAELVVGPPYRVQPGGWALTRNEVIFIDRAARDRSTVIRAYNPATKAIRSIFSLNEVFADRDDIGLSVSPDEKWILYSQLDRSGSNIMLAEGR